MLIYIEPERIDSDFQGERSGRELFDDLVRQGLRAQLRTGNMLTGKLYVDLDFFPQVPQVAIDYRGAYPVFPTVPRPLDEITASLDRILSRLDKVPFETIGTELRDALAHLNRNLQKSEQVLETMNASVAPQLISSLRKLDELMEGVDEGSDLQLQTRQTLQELDAAARAVRNLAYYLDRHPEALLRGKGDAP